MRKAETEVQKKSIYVHKCRCPFHDFGFTDGPKWTFTPPRVLLYAVITPILFTLYTKELNQIAKRHGFNIHMYADDTQLYIEFNPLFRDLSTIEERITNCFEDIKTWMTQNKLKLNQNKTEALVVQTKNSYSSCPVDSIQLDNAADPVDASHTVKSLGVLFGDKEAYLNKFLTCARTREFDNQALDHTFFQLEHCKPLFKQQNILAFKNLYTYHTFMEVFKILKLRCPTSLNQHYQLSSRKQTALIAQLPSNDFISRSTKIWSTIAPKLKLFDFSYKISLAKSHLKKSLLRLQHAYNDSAWTSSDYDMMQLSFENNPLQKM